MRNIGWVAIAALLVAAAVGLMAYNAGVAQGIAQSGKIVAVPGGPYPYAYYPHPWGFGFFFAPFFFILFFFFITRVLFWRGAWHRGLCGDGGFYEWHRRAHERMTEEAAPR